MLEDLLSKLGASTRITVGVSVSPGLGLEMIEVDRATNTVNKYGYKELEYNSSTREIADYDQFRLALEELFEDLRIPKRSNIVLSLPNVHFGLMSLPLLLTDDAITNAIISEVEQSYVFKRQEPIVGWSEIISNSGSENRTLAFTAIQKDALEKITQACEEVGCTLVCVENSFSSLFRTMTFLDLAREQFKENVSWNLMLIMQNNYSIISMNGKNIVEYYEEPLALKSFVDDEIYNAIKSSAQLTLTGLPANYLYIISETDLVSAEVLSMKIATDSTVNFLECNKFSQDEMVPVNLNVLPKVASEITPEAIGAAIYQFCDSPLKLNIAKELNNELGMNDTEECPRINIGNLEVELTPDFIKKISLMLGAIIVIPAFIIFLILNNLIINKEQARLDAITSKMDSISAEIKKYENENQNNTFDPKTTIEKYSVQNKIKMAYYSALGVTVPNKLWLTYYKLSGEGKVDIRGGAKDVKSVYTFYKDLKQSVINSDIRLHKLEIPQGSIDDIVSNGNSSKLYLFEITNMTEDELNQPAAASTSAPQQGANGQNQPATETSGYTSAFSKYFPSNQSTGAQTAPVGQQPNQPAGQPAVPPVGSGPIPTQPSMPPATQATPPLPSNLKKIENF